MLENIGKYYLYRHIRLDKNEPFYIGIGTKVNKKSFLKVTSEYVRAYSKTRRNKIWIDIVSKTDYEVEILLESDNYEFIKQKEIEFIALYGRKNLSKGSLSNLTEGDDGNVGWVCSKETSLKFSESRTGEKNYLSKPIIDTQTKEIYCNLQDLCNKKSFKYMTYYSKLNGKNRQNNSPYVYLEDYSKQNYTCNEKRKVILSNWKKLEDIITGKVYDNITECAKDLEICPTKLKRMLDGYYINKGVKYPYTNTTNIKYKNEL